VGGLDRDGVIAIMKHHAKSYLFIIWINHLNEIENISRLIHLSLIRQIVIPFTLYNKRTSLINYTYKIYTFSNIKIQSKKNVPRKKPKPIKQKPSVPLSLIKSYSNNQLDLFGRHDPFQ